MFAKIYRSVLSSFTRVPLADVRADAASRDTFVRNSEYKQLKAICFVVSLSVLLNEYLVVSMMWSSYQNEHFYNIGVSLT